jgi:tripartite-type tricarboxylate transporter receptor subunit TctC
MREFRYKSDEWRRQAATRQETGMRLSILMAGVGLALAANVGAARAQAWPNRPVHVVVPFAAGGGLDLTARVFADKLQQQLGQPVVIDNRAGAGGNVGVESVARATPDGYTFLINTNGQSISPAIYKKLNWDPFKDFIPVTQIFQSSATIIANLKSPYKDLRDLLAAARAKPGAINYGASGVGNALHLNMAWLAQRAGVDMQMVPFRNDALIANAVLANEVPVGVVPSSSAPELVLAGTVRGLAITTPERVKQMPDVGTVAEQGLPGFAAPGYQAYFAPAGTPMEIVERLAREVKIALASPEIQQYADRSVVQPIGSTPAEFAAFYKKDVENFIQIVHDAKIPMQE